MGSLAIPPSGLIYVDSDILIYSVDTHSLYWPLLEPLWQATRAGSISIVSSELALMETLVGPMRAGDAALVTTYEQVFQSPEIELIPISRAILKEASRLRARHLALRTPDALHASTAMLAACSVFLTDDIGFRRVAGLPVVILDGVLATP